MKKYSEILRIGLLMIIAFCIQNPLKAQEAQFYTIVPEMPTFGNGNDDMFKYFIENSTLPLTARRTDSTNAMFVSVIIEPDGKITFKGVARGSGDLEAAEAQRLIEEMPKWSIGRLNDGTAVRVSYTIPFWFVKRD
jgi:hypothetical protein